MMAENAPPHGLPMLDLAMLATERRISQQPTPMTTDRLYNTDRVQLISPPPEETLAFRRRTTPTSKRKRTGLQILAEEPPVHPQEATPNPKPRKQSKRHPNVNDSPIRSSSQSSPTTTPSKPQRANLAKSPHAVNPDADFIPDIPLNAPRRSVVSARARRTTPIPPYDPPTEVFTPPREVIMTPSIPKSSKRKTITKQNTSKGKVLKVAIPAPSIKRELPDIDLSAPMPPPSPSDDPLLLSGPILPPSSSPIRPPRERERRGVGLVASASLSHSLAPRLPPSPPVAISLPPSSSQLTDMEGVQPFNWARHSDPESPTDFSMLEMDDGDADVPPLPLFNLNLADLPASSDAGGWSDSEEEDRDLTGDADNEDEVEGKGEYTGKWRMVKVRTKLDPPSSATRERMEEWGRPITPFPRRIAKLDLFKEVHDEEEQVTEEDVKNEVNITYREEARELCVPLDGEDDEEQEVRQMSLEFESQDLERRDTAMEGVFDFDTSVDGPVVSEEVLFHMGTALQGGLDDMSTVMSFNSHSDHLSPTDEEDEEEREVRQMSVEFEDEEDARVKDCDASHMQNGSLNLASSISASFPRQESTVQPRTIIPSAANELSCLKQAVSLDSYATVNKVMEDVRSVCKVSQEGEISTATEGKTTEAVDGDSTDDGEDCDCEDGGMVKITSADPRAAARAAAILKQHDYDCFTKIMMMKRGRQSGVDGLSKSSRRKTISGAGIVKGKDKESERRRCSIGVVGDRVYIPGSPTTTLPQLLREAEAEVVTGTPVKWVGIRDSFKTPSTPARFGVALASPAAFGRGEDERPWGKEDWKQLDACFTDERLETGRRLDMGEGEEALAPVDCVIVEDVVQRFVLLVGGDKVIESFGDGWNRDNICQRVKALQNKQRSGNIAPPTTPYTPSPGGLMSRVTRRVPSMEVPDFTPLGKLVPSPGRRRPVSPSLVVNELPFTNLPKQPEGPVRTLPASLLAPRYSHLLEEAIAVSQLGAQVVETSVANVGKEVITSVHQETALANGSSTPADHQDDSPTTNDTNRLPATPATIGKRVKGFFFSYLPTLSKTAPPASRGIKQRQHGPGLPLPPPEVLEKPRGPISTPVRQPLPKPKPPKELVHLNPAPQPEPKASMLPPAKKPRRLVELQPLPPPTSPAKPVAVPRPRRSSGGSVKDLVQSFEDLERYRVEKAGVKKIELKRVKSKSDWKSITGNKPGWRP